jgi:hypothetical protein
MNMFDAVVPKITVEAAKDVPIAALGGGKLT